MKNIYAMLAKVKSLDEIRENERAKAAESLQKEIRAFTAHYGEASTDVCPCAWRTYVLLRDGIILRKKEDDDDEGETLQVNSLFLTEMEFIHNFMVDTLNRESESIKDAVERYIDLCQ